VAVVIIKESSFAQSWFARGFWVQKRWALAALAEYFVFSCHLAVLGHVLERVSWFVPYVAYGTGFLLDHRGFSTIALVGYPVAVPHCRLDCLMPSSVWDWWCQK
jgi:hypothetical protein